MGCNCGKGKTNQGYVVNKPDGTKSKVKSLQEAISVARRSGGTYQRARA
jgi:hypothetical protein